MNRELDGSGSFLQIIWPHPNPELDLAFGVPPRRALQLEYVGWPLLADAPIETIGTSRLGHPRQVEGPEVRDIQIAPANAQSEIKRIDGFRFTAWRSWRKRQDHP